MIGRPALISLFVLMAGLITGYFAFRLSSGWTLFHMPERNLSVWQGDPAGSDTSLDHFYGSAVELSHLYHRSREDFQEVLDGGRHSLREVHAQRERLEEIRDTISSSPEDINRQIESLDRETDLIRLTDYYTQYFMHFYRWLETGNAGSSVNHKLAMGQFRATVSYHLEKYADDAGLRETGLDYWLTGTRLAEQSDRAIRWARVSVVVLLFTLVMGIPRFIRDRGYRKFAATLYFDALFRPNRVSDLNAWHSMGRMAMVLVLFYLFAGVVLTSFRSWLVPLVLGSLGLLPVLVLLGLTGNRRKSREQLISYMAPKALILIAVLLVVAVRGPMYLCHFLVVSALFRALFLAGLFMLLFHKLRVHVLLARKWSHRNRRAALAMVGVAAGLQLLLAGGLLQFAGLDRSLQALNGDLMILPMNGPGDAGISYWLQCPSSFPAWLMAIAGIMLIVSLVVFIFNRKAVTASIHAGKA